MNELKSTPLTGWHAAHGGRMVDFAGYSMPVQYEGVIAEHRAVREHCGVFDVSHMAELRITGGRARVALDHLVTNDLRTLAPGAALYTALCHEGGGVLDDLLVYCVAEDDFLVVANASNHQKVHAWFAGHLGEGAELEDQTAATALFALQGPRSLDVLRAWPGLRQDLGAVEGLEYYHHTQVSVDGAAAMVSRTGYTGEWGYELYVPVEQAVGIWTALLAAGEPHGLRPVGLGARDTLRLEAGYSLYGHELDEETTPLEAGIGWVVKLKGADFIGKQALLRQKEQGVPRRTIALKLQGRGIGRQGAPVLSGSDPVGVVTSGTFSPSLEVSIALARVATEAIESPLVIDVRGRRIEAERVSIPFVPSRVRG